MAKLSKKTFDKVLDDFKGLYFISAALEANEIRPYDFYEYMKRNEEGAKEFEEIDRFNNAYKEAQIERKVYEGDFSKPILLEMIKARDKKKYTQKVEFEDTTPLSKLSDEDLNRKIQEIQERMGK